MAQNPKKAASPRSTQARPRQEVPAVPTTIAEGCALHRRRCAAMPMAEARQRLKDALGKAIVQLGQHVIGHEGDPIYSWRISSSDWASIGAALSFAFDRLKEIDLVRFDAAQAARDDAGFQQFLIDQGLKD